MARQRRLATKNARDGYKAKVYRVIDFGRTKRGIYGEIQTVEYDPYRNCRICLVKYEDGEHRYILHALGYFVGQQIISDIDAPPFVGNAMPLDKVPIGTQVHCLESIPGKGGKVARAAGACITVLAQEEDFITVKMPSTEVRMYPKDGWCTIGRIGRVEANMIKLGKASKTLQLGWKQTVRGSAMNAVDHPHGGGEGRSPIGHPYQKRPNGKSAHGGRTQRPKALITKFLLIRAKKRSGRS